MKGTGYTRALIEALRTSTYDQDIWARMAKAYGRSSLITC